MSSNEYVPNIDTMRDCFLDGAEGNFVAEDFDRAIAAIKAEAKMEALREAADEFRNCPDYGYRATRLMVTENYLNDRADRIKLEMESG